MKSVSITYLKQLKKEQLMELAEQKGIDLDPEPTFHELLVKLSKKRFKTEDIRKFSRGQKTHAEGVKDLHVTMLPFQLVTYRRHKTNISYYPDIIKGNNSKYDGRRKFIMIEYVNSIDRFLLDLGGLLYYKKFSLFSKGTCVAAVVLDDGIFKKLFNYPRSIYGVDIIKKSAFESWLLSKVRKCYGKSYVPKGLWEIIREEQKHHRHIS